MPDARRDDGRPQRLPEPWPPEQVRQVTGMFLSLADEALPGLVEGLYLHGSLGFGEWYDGRSDVDFVAVGAARLEAATVAVLRDIHGRLTETFPVRRSTGSTSPGTT